MKPLKNYTGKAALLDVNNVDTDQIIPQIFLRRIGRTGFGEFAFYNWRYNEDGSENSEFELNKEPFKGASILVTGDNFGCGSSREHAPWALLEYGYTIIISSSFADIFQNNCYKNGMLPIVVNPDVLEDLKKEVRENQGVNFSIELEKQVLITSKKEIYFDVDAFRKEFLIKGLDDIKWTLQFEDHILQFEKNQQQSKPWLWNK